MAFYLDTSALVKLVVTEPETRALRAWLRRGQRTTISSDLARTELMRAVRRGAPNRIARAREVLDSLELIVLDTALFESAGRLDPEILRSLDAIHLAAALELGDDLEGLLTYDNRLGAAARSQGVAVHAPGSGLG